MKKNAIYATLLAAIWAAAWFTAHAAQQTINLGTAPTGADGDTHRVAFGKVNSNFDELYAVGNETAIEAALDTLPNVTSVQGHTVTLTGNFVRSGAHSLTLTTTGATSVTLPTSGTLLADAGLGTGVGAWLATPSSANLATAVTGETGSGALVFGTSPGFTTAANPVSNDGAALGTTALGWSDLHLATGALINFSNGNWTATHSSGVLTIGSSMDIRMTTAGTNSASVVTVGGTQTLTNKTLTAPVIGAATGTSLATTGLLHAFSGTATPAGGTAGSGIRVGSTSNLGLFFGSGAPTLAAAQGSLYIRTDGAPYYNNNGTTGWTALTASVDQAGNYTWTGTHDYTTATVTFGTVTVGTITGTTLNMSGGSVRLPVAAGAATLAASGAVSYNTTNKQLGIHNGAKEVAVPTIMHVVKTFDPKAVCDGAVDRLFIMTTGVSEPFGITVVGWKVSFEADPTTEVDLDLKRADAVIGVANAAVMDVLDTTAGASAEATAANINGGAVVANGKTIYLEFGTAYTETTHQIIFEMWYEIEED
jgi:hypothetical protein